MEADEVTIVVHGARGLQGKKPGRHKFSVVFGVGTKKYRTSTVKEPSGNPDWNEESVVRGVNVSDHVFFNITEKDDILGQLIIPVASLLTVKGVVKKSSLKAYKKCMNPQGELIFQCYVSKQRPIMVTPQIIGSNTGTQLTGFQRLRHSLSPSPPILQKKDDKEDKKRSNSLVNFNKKLSKSLHDIFHIGKFTDSKSDLWDNEQPSNKGKRFSLRLPSLGSELDKSDKDIPIVTHIIPNIAPTLGGTRLVLEGQNLGIGKSDIMELMLCGSDLLDSIHFESENRIYVTTKPTSAGKGDLWIETISGGQNVIKNIFTFIDRSASTGPAADKEGSESGSFSSRRNSTLAESLADTPTITETDPSIAESEDSVNPCLNVERSSSLNKEDRQRRRVSISESATLPRMFNSGEAVSSSSSISDSPTGKYRKNFNKHARRASESVVIINKEVEERKSSEKAELQAEILRLHKENQALKQENADMKVYIDGLVARVMIHCPEALAAGDDLKPLKSGT